MIKNIPDDVFTTNIFANDNFILVIDPKHTNDSFHYTIWCINDIETIYDITEQYINNLQNFINLIKKMNLFTNEKIYFSFPPTYNRLHLHIVPKEYISYRPNDQLYYFDDIDQIYQNIQKIKYINQQKDLSRRLDSKFEIGVYIMNNLENINQINFSDIDYVIIIRKSHPDKYIEELINNHKLINVHIISANMNNYYEMIKYDKLIYI